MSGSVLFQLFIMVNVFFIGVLTSIAIRHVLAHFRQQEHEIEAAHHKNPAAHLPIATKERLLHTAEANFQAIIDRSTKELERNLGNINLQASKRVEKLTQQIIDKETEHYQTTLNKLQTEAVNKGNTVQSEIDKYQVELKAKLTARQIELENQLTARMNERETQAARDLDTKLADGIAAFLTETMQHNIDIGAQSDYLIATLNEHKSELIASITKWN